MLGILIVVAGGLVIALALIGYLGTPVQIQHGSYRTGMAVSLILVGLSLAAAVVLAAYLLVAGGG